MLKPKFVGLTQRTSATLRFKCHNGQQKCPCLCLNVAESVSLIKSCFIHCSLLPDSVHLIFLFSFQISTFLDLFLELQMKLAWIDAVCSLKFNSSCLHIYMKNYNFLLVFDELQSNKLSSVTTLSSAVLTVLLYTPTFYIKKQTSVWRD